MFNKRAKRPTKAEAQRLHRLHDLPCICCHAEQGLMQPFPTEAHHLLSGNKRKGHAYTIPLCSWHHAGTAIYGWMTGDMAIRFGPSLALNSKKFHETYGSDELLLRATNELLEKHP
jgi:hypothetical protein